MKDQWTSRLSEYIDGELQPGEQQALEAHLETCAECRRTLDELRRVVARVQETSGRPPANDLWPGIARRIGVSVTPAVRDLDERRRVNERRRFAFTVPQLAAAAIVLALGSAGGAYVAFRHPPPAVSLPPTADGSSPDLRLARWWRDSTQVYDADVAQLQRVLEVGRGSLDTGTVRVLEQNLAIIDKAIAEAKKALDADPSSSYLSMHLAQTMRTKLELLRRAQTLVVQS